MNLAVVNVTFFVLTACSKMKMYKLNIRDKLNLKWSIGSKVKVDYVHLKNTYTRWKYSQTDGFLPPSKLNLYNKKGLYVDRKHLLNIFDIPFLKVDTNWLLLYVPSIAMQRDNLQTNISVKSYLEMQKCPFDKGLAKPLVCSPL